MLKWLEITPSPTLAALRLLSAVLARRGGAT